LDVAPAFAHNAVLTMDAGGDVRAPGAAITVALCGHWEHEPPCPLAPHHTAAARERGQVRLRTLFVTEAEREQEVREKIGAALRSGRLVGPDGRESTWRLASERAATVRADEAEQAGRLAHG
jgi:hypothetical protein